MTTKPKQLAHIGDDAWKAFVIFADGNSIDVDGFEEDWKPWWDCWYNGHISGYAAGAFSVE